MSQTVAQSSATLTDIKRTMIQHFVFFWNLVVICDFRFVAGHFRVSHAGDVACLFCFRFVGVSPWGIANKLTISILSTWSSSSCRIQITLIIAHHLPAGG